MVTVVTPTAPSGSEMSESPRASARVCLETVLDVGRLPRPGLSPLTASASPRVALHGTPNPSTEVLRSVAQMASDALSLAVEHDMATRACASAWG